MTRPDTILIRRKLAAGLTAVAKAALIDGLCDYIDSLPAEATPEDYDQLAVAAEHLATAEEWRDGIARSINPGIGQVIGLASETLAAVKAMLG